MSERTLHADVKTEVQGSLVRPVALCEMDFPSGAVNVWTGQGSITWDSKTWSGTGELITFSTFPERTDGSSQGIKISVNGVDTDLVSDAVDDDWQGDPVSVWIAFLDSSGAVVGDPWKLFGGKMDTSEIFDDGNKATITINAESRLIDQLRPIQWRYTDQDQQNLYSGTTDLGLEFVATLQDVKALWRS